MPTITCNYGYDIHSSEISADIANMIAAKKSVKFLGQGFCHEETGLVEDEWFYDGPSDTFIICLDGEAQLIGQEFWISDD